jgi:hypothetical protein
MRRARHSNEVVRPFFVRESSQEGDHHFFGTRADLRAQTRALGCVGSKPIKIDAVAHERRALRRQADRE